MEGSNPAGAFPNSQSVLGDITNQHGKRGLNLISSDSVNKTVGDKEGISQFTKRVCLGVENIVREKCDILTTGNENEKCKNTRVLPNENILLSGDVISGTSKVSTEMKESGNVISSLALGINNVITDNLLEGSEVVGDSCTLLPIVTGTKEGVKENCNNDDDQDDLYIGCSQTGESLAQIIGKDNEGIAVGNFNMGKPGMVEFSAMHESHVPESSKLEKFRSLIGDSCSNKSGDIDLLKSCSCSFCVKAAYIWSDLHYQDVKGRIAALKKSQKEATIMRERSSRYKGSDKQSHGKDSSVSRLESDLTGQWRSLFHHMENIFEREGNQLETNLLSLRDVRDNCKTDLEKVNGIPREKQ